MPKPYPSTMPYHNLFHSTLILIHNLHPWVLLTSSLTIDPNSPHIHLFIFGSLLSLWKGEKVREPGLSIIQAKKFWVYFIFYCLITHQQNMLRKQNKRNFIFQS